MKQSVAVKLVHFTPRSCSNTRCYLIHLASLLAWDQHGYSNPASGNPLCKGTGRLRKPCCFLSASWLRMTKNLRETRHFPSKASPSSAGERSGTRRDHSDQRHGYRQGPAPGHRSWLRAPITEGPVLILGESLLQKPSRWVFHGISVGSEGEPPSGLGRAPPPSSC